jgi:hypothetical protein
MGGMALQLHLAQAREWAVAETASRSYRYGQAIIVEHQRREAGAATMVVHSEGATEQLEVGEAVAGATAAR